MWQRLYPAGHVVEQETIANIPKTRYRTQVGRTVNRWCDKIVAEQRDGFSSFLISAAVAGVSIGGTWVFSNINDQRAEARDVAVLANKVENLSNELRRLTENLTTTLVLTVRVENVEKLLDKQQEALDALRHSTVPNSQQRVK